MKLIIFFLSLFFFPLTYGQGYELSVFNYFHDNRPLEISCARESPTHRHLLHFQNVPLEHWVSWNFTRFSSQTLYVCYVHVWISYLPQTWFRIKVFEGSLSYDECFFQPQPRQPNENGECFWNLNDTAIYLSDHRGDDADDVLKFRWHECVL